MNLLLSLLLALLSEGTGLAATALPSGADIRGITLSTHTDGSDWGSGEIASTMQDLQDVGANWVAIHPYAAIHADGRVTFRTLRPGHLPGYLSRPIGEAHEHGLRVLLKPHLAYWGSPFRWRGDIDFTTPEQWQRFFATYEAWITNLAAACPHVDALVVATELDRTLPHESEWRHVVESVRRQTKASLTYAANWSHYTTVPFWDALDFIGIQAYFPLSDRVEADREVLQKSWRHWMQELHVFSARMKRPIVFTELGYNRSFSAHVRPWEYRIDGPPAEEMQALCLEVALESVKREESVLGAFLWKWFPNPKPVGRNFQLATPRLKQAIRSIWQPAAYKQ